MGAGMVECDVTFTAAQQLVCRHAQCDLHQTTDILLRPQLAAKCRSGFTPADAGSGRKASAQCCTSDITLAEFSQLCTKMDGVNPDALQVADYVKGTPNWRTDLYSQCASPMSVQADWYYQSLPWLAQNDSAILQLLHVLAQDVGVRGVFSDWPGTTTFYANCLLAGE